MLNHGMFIKLLTHLSWQEQVWPDESLRLPVQQLIEALSLLPEIETGRGQDTVIARPPGTENVTADVRDRETLQDDIVQEADVAIIGALETIQGQDRLHVQDLGHLRVTDIIVVIKI